ncbi:MAG: CDP-alcohol phosphatidyltransferase family protein [Prevotellaceae bacterium]|nr:CDP-alcohol phosphatidyltransferase family protein [Prevotellaceae bacterium]
MKKQEQNALAFLVRHVPAFISPNMLTAIGLAGSFVVLASFILASWANSCFLLLGIAGFAIHWLGDSLDGRIAYYRNSPRKWYGTSLDVSVDWISVICIGLGYMFYANGGWKLGGFVFVVLYGWSMLLAQLRYKVTNRYSIDSGLFGPTEVRIILSLMLVCEVVIPRSIHYVSSLCCAILLIVNVLDFFKLLKIADLKDKAEKGI